MSRHDCWTSNYMKAYQRVCLHQNGVSQGSVIEIILFVGLGECACDLTKSVSWIPEDFFFLIDTDSSWQSCISEARSTEEKELLISPSLFHLRYFEDRPLEPECKKSCIENLVMSITQTPDDMNVSLAFPLEFSSYWKSAVGVKNLLTTK